MFFLRNKTGTCELNFALNPEQTAVVTSSMQSKLLAYVLILVICLDGAEGINLPNLKVPKLPNLPVVRTNVAVVQHINRGAAAKTLQCMYVLC
jgi:hypothetical protein